MKQKILGLFFLFSLFAMYSFLDYQSNNDPWIVPEKYQKLKNPYEANKASIAVGKTLYSQHCKSCHGKEGLGDGSKAKQLETPCGDFSLEEFHEQSDGAIFYKIKEGRDDMPTFAKKIPDDEDIWHIVNFIRTMME